MKTLAASLLVFLVTLTGFAQVAILQDGTPVKLRFSRTVSSAQTFAKLDEAFPLALKHLVMNY